MEAIIIAIITLLLPFLSKLLENLFQKKLEAAAKKITVAGNETDAEVARKILGKMLEGTPKVRFGLRSLIRIAIRAIPSEGSIPKTLSKSAAEEAKEAAKVAKKEI